MIAGLLAGIARHDRPKGPMETVGSVPVTFGEGLYGNYRGGLAATRPGRKRQVLLGDGLRAASISDWRAGFLARVIESGEIAVGDTIRIER